MRRADKHLAHNVLLLGRHTAYANSAAVLRTVFRNGNPLDIARIGQREHAVLNGN